MGASIHRRHVLASTAGIAAASLFGLPMPAWGDASVYTYRGFTVDVSASLGAPNLAEIKKALEHQMDICADCGALPKIIDFFKSQQISVKPGSGDGGGSFSANQKGIKIDAAVDPPQKPIVLHEMLHAYHYRMLPGSSQNPDVIKFFQNAKRGEFYPANEYMLRNPFEFFAVTASLYLWGNVDREPHTRKNLQAKQPYYYVWLADLFGVKKDATA